MRKNKTQALIVGGGPCGLMAALLLGKSGINTVVLEKHPGISRHPKAMGVTRRTAEIYRCHPPFFKTNIFVKKKQICSFYSLEL